MPINVSEALDTDTAILLIVKRKSGGQRVDGVWVPGAETNVKILASPQPADANDLQNLPEGERDKDIFKFISNKPVYTTEDRDGQEADEVIFEGNRYRVISSANWNLFGHSTVLAAKL